MSARSSRPGDTGATTINGAVKIAVSLLVITLASLVGALSASASPGDTERVSVDSAGNQGNDESDFPAVSADGRYVAFTSAASNLVSGDSNAESDVFVRDRLTGSTERVSVDSAGNEANGLSTFPPGISADGRYVAFASLASNLVAADTNGTFDVFVRDRLTGSTERVSVDTAGNEADSASLVPAVSADGRHVVFVSFASNLVSGDTNGEGDAFVHDRLTGSTERVSVDSAGNQGNGATPFSNTPPGISADGRHVAFQSQATNLVAGDTNNQTDIFARDRLTGTTERVSVDSAGNQSNDVEFAALDVAISADGRYVAFRSYKSDLVPGDTNGSPCCNADIFVRDRQAGTTERVSVDSAGNEANGDNAYASISADGRYVAFVSSASNLVGGDTNGTFDVFVHDRQADATERVSVDSAGNEGNSLSRSPSISADGGFVAFYSFSSNLAAGDTNGSGDVFIHERGVAAPTQALIAASPVHAWIGLKNSDDQGTQFDLLAELLKNGTTVASGLKRCITGVTRNPSLATEAIVPWDTFPPVTLGPGDVLSLRLSTRIGTNPNGTKCAGPGGSHNNAVGLRLYYDSVTRASRFDWTIAPNPNQDEYLHSDGNPCSNAQSTGVTTRDLNETPPTAANAKCKDSAAVNFAGGNPLKVIGTWSHAPQP